jgi:hypothetical protein
VADYADARQHIFPSTTSMTWFIRQHRVELVHNGALLMIAGRWFAEPAAFDSYILEAGKRSAQEKIGRE